MDKKKEITIEDIPGVGEKIAQKLKDIGYTDPMTIAVTSPAELASIAEIGEGQATKIINSVREMLEIGYETADKILQRRANVVKITTGSKNLDNLLGGGVETQAITEAYGPYGSGKTQLGFQLAVNTQLPKERGGLGGNVIWIDTENTFRPERIVQIAKGLKLDAEKTLKNIFVSRAFNSEHQILLIEKAPEMIEQNNVRLIVIDSLTSHFRADFVGRGELAGRQQKLNKHLHQLQRLADAFNLAIYVTNQVMADPSVLFGDPTRAVGGHVLAHMCVTPDTLVQLSGGSIVEAKDVHNPLVISGMDFNSLKLGEGRCNGVFSSRKDKIMEINHSLKVSPEHTVFKVKGFDIVEIEAKYLKRGDYLIVPRKIEAEGEEVDLPQIEIERVFIISPEGSRLIKEEAKKKNISLKRNNKHLFGITPRQMRRVLNQGYPTNEVVIRNIERILGINLENYVKEKETNKHKSITIPNKLNPNIAQILGYLIGDGNLCANSLRFRDSRNQVLEEYGKIFQRTFNLGGSITKLRNKNCFQLEISNKSVSRLFNYLKNNYFTISKSKRECVKAFLRGIFDAEGSITNNKLSLTNKNKQLLEFCKLLLLRFGIHSQVNKHTNNTFRLLVIRDIEKFFTLIGLTALDKVGKLRKLSSEREMIPIDRVLLNEIFKKYKIKQRKDLKYVTREYLEKLCESNHELKTVFAKLLNSDIAFEKITAIKVLKNKDELIDLSIPATENFIANGYLVHNSTYRLYLRRGKEGMRVAKMIDAPNLMEAECVFKITEDGLRDP
jgi:DNA repair protein RadA